MVVSFKRSERVSDEIMKEVSGMIVRGEIRDPRVCSVYVTGAKVSDNLSVADLYFTVIDEGDADKHIPSSKRREEALRGLERAKGFIKSKLAKRLRMRKIPDLRFGFDSALEEAYKVDEALRGISSE